MKKIWLLTTALLLTGATKAQQPEDTTRHGDILQGDIEITATEPHTQDNVTDSDTICIEMKNGVINIRHNNEVFSTSTSQALLNPIYKSADDTINLRGDYELDKIDIDPAGSLSMKLRPRRYPRLDIDFRFLWGFHNWGDNMVNGLTGTEGPYDIRTSFSSYQLELMSNILFNKQWQLGIGVAYESDVYKFRNGYVGFMDMQNATMTGADYVLYNATASQITAAENVTGNLADPGVWNTRLVARYINIPIRVGWNSRRGKVHMGFSVIPGFNYDGKHTGLKHRLDLSDYDYQNIDHDAEKMLNSFKCDLRFDISRGCIGLFVQIPTMPVSTGLGNVKLYPFKIGLFI